jgi:catechol 2,3-dioxygenase-like lactoylglutathione lyase family enzyme
MSTAAQPQPFGLRPHFSLPSQDIERSRRFYEALFNMPATKVRKGYVKFSVARPAINFSLTESSSTAASNGGTRHYGIEVDSPEAVTEFRQRLSAAGVAVGAESQGVCCYSQQSKFWVEDPDGNPWEIFHVSADSEAFSESKSKPGLAPPQASASCCATDCCT